MLIGLLGMSGAHPYLAIRLDGVISAWVGCKYKIAPHFSGWFLLVVPESLNLCGLLIVYVLHVYPC